MNEREVELESESTTFHFIKKVGGEIVLRVITHASPLSLHDTYIAEVPAAVLTTKEELVIS